jgi:hypothetical protein
MFQHNNEDYKIKHEQDKVLVNAFFLVGESGRKFAEFRLLKTKAGGTFFAVLRLNLPDGASCVSTSSIESYGSDTEIALVHGICDLLKINRNGWNSFIRVENLMRIIRKYIEDTYDFRVVYFSLN